MRLLVIWTVSACLLLASPSHLQGICRILIVDSYQSAHLSGRLLPEHIAASQIHFTYLARAPSQFCGHAFNERH
ncbi:hypothetical protein EDC04DRAFT_378633 [Pisolithus marmoratus]|nr:hypothetical protein EDC04DRAFT_378633 [Pisolithus marmoratus]